MEDDPTVSPEVDPAELTSVYRRMVDADSKPHAEPIQVAPSWSALTDAQRALMVLAVVFAACCMIGLAVIAGDGRAAPVEPDPWCDIDWWGCVDAEDDLVDYRLDQPRFEPGEGLFGS